MSKIKAGLNKIVLEQTAAAKTDSKITLPDHLKEKKYRVLNIGPTRTTLEKEVSFVKEGDIIHLVPGTGFTIKEGGEEYIVCTYDDILAII